MSANRQSNYSKSVYAPGQDQGDIRTHTLSILVDNEPAVLARVIGLFSGRGYNIDSLTVAETDHDNSLSRITIVTSGTEIVIDLIRAQLENIVPVRSVHDLTLFGAHISRELALVKIVGSIEDHDKAKDVAAQFDGRIVDETSESCVFEVKGDSKEVDDFIEAMRPLGLLDVSRSGVAAISLGTKKIGDEWILF